MRKVEEGRKEKAKENMVSMMEMAFFSTNDSFDREVWPKIYPWFLFYTRYFFIKSYSLLSGPKAAL